MTESVDRPPRVAVVYYSATGHVQALAEAVAQGAENAGASVRLRHVEEFASEMLISQNQAWGRHRSEVSDEPTAMLDDLDWADGIAFGTPTRFGNVAAQLKMFLDQAGQLWEDGKLINKVVTSFTSSQTVHGGQESTILALNNTFYHWGAIVLPLGYTVKEVFNGGGNPYGASYTSGTKVGQLDSHTVASAVAQGGRLARVARIIGSAQERGLLDVRRSFLAASEMRAARPLSDSKWDGGRDGVDLQPPFPAASEAKRCDQGCARPVSGLDIDRFGATQRTTTSRDAVSSQAPTRSHVGDPPADPLALDPYSPVAGSRWPRDRADHREPERAEDCAQ